MGGAKLIIAKHVACHVTEHSPDSRKENMLSLLTDLGKGYCCLLLPQIRPEGKVLSSQIAFCAHTTRLQMCRRRDVIAGSSAPISPIRIYSAKINTKQQALANKSLWLEDLTCYFSLFQVSGADSFVYQKSLNVSEQTCNVYWS